MSKEYKSKTQELKRALFTLFPGLCKGCGLCIEKCPKKSLSWSDTLGVYGTPTVKANDRVYRLRHLSGGMSGLRYPRGKNEKGRQ